MLCARTAPQSRDCVRVRSLRLGTSSLRCVPLRRRYSARGARRTGGRLSGSSSAPRRVPPVGAVCARACAPPGSVGIPPVAIRHAFAAHPASSAVRGACLLLAVLRVLCAIGPAVFVRCGRETPAPGILLAARMFVSRAGGLKSPLSPTYEQPGDRTMKFFLLLFLITVEPRHRTVVGYAFVDTSVASHLWLMGHCGRLGASTPFRRHARYRLDLGVAQVHAGFPRRANYLPPGQGCRRPSDNHHGTVPGKGTTT